MQHSSRAQPCPVCTRDRDDKCRWDEHRLLCFVGETFAPPANLEPGEVITGEDGIQWAFVRHGAGFANASALFVPHVDRPLPSQDPAERLLQAQRNAAMRTGLRMDLALLPGRVEAALGAPDYELLPLAEIRHWTELISRTHTWVGKVRKRTMELRHLAPELAVVLPELADHILQLAYQEEDFQSFLGDALLDPMAKGRRGEELADQMGKASCTATPDSARAA